MPHMSLVLACSAIALSSLPSAVIAQDAPIIPEPMVFDMVRPLGAKRGELEANTLAERNLSGAHRAVEWAPEVEYAIVDGFAVEAELPFDGARLTDYKLGLQGTFGTFSGGRAIHGVQYLGLYNRASTRWESTLVYVLGYRFDERLSTMMMAGVGDVTFGGSDQTSLIVNHSTFYDLSADTVLGLEVNFKRGGEHRTLVMPQLHQDLTTQLSLQAGVGAVREEHEPWRPRAAVRLIKEF
ncbi:hypothetical protein ABVV53_15305 [Novosphingobium sp. RD2P27]|uniref:Uncharacterized protein n=1 Tax=Novosphingobium kalidii TaxID=3230299 RepID=A0ABV2D4L8_9SPHN